MNNGGENMISQDGTGYVLDGERKENKDHSNQLKIIEFAL